MNTSPIPLTDTSRLAVHTITTKPLPIEQACEAYRKVGVAGITIWRDALTGRDPAIVGRNVRDSGLEIVSLCRGGFFPNTSEQGRMEALDDNRRAIEEAHALGAPMIVLVCGAAPKQSLDVSRAQIQDGIETILPEAQAAGVRLGIEPLHPMYADSRSAINTLGQANDLAEAIASPWVGIAIDVYHVWWDPNLKREIARCGLNGHLFAFHICDWKTPTTDLLFDRGLMGEGCIPIKKIRGWVEATGFRGFNEVEIFSKIYWDSDQGVFLDKIKEAYLTAS